MGNCPSTKGAGPACCQIELEKEGIRLPARGLTEYAGGVIFSDMTLESAGQDLAEKERGKVLVRKAVLLVNAQSFRGINL